MERITSRKNTTITRLRALGADRSSRREAGLYLCDGEKLLREALSSGAEIDCVLWAVGESFDLKGCNATQLTAPAELVEFVSPLKNTAGPVFSVRMRELGIKCGIKSALVLENVQDPGNVGTAIRTANALGIGAVVLTGDCADIYNLKTVRAAMGAVFRQPVLTTDLEGLSVFLAENRLKLFGAALSQNARDVRSIETENIAIAIGNEGEGLSGELLSLCDGQVIIPMEPGSQSLNASVAAAILMWEIRRGRGDI